MINRPPPRLRLIDRVRLLWGFALLLAPGALLGEWPDARVDRRARVFARLLGTRQLAQALVLSKRGGPGWIAAGAAVDTTHAATMVALAVVDRRRRALASANALTATTFALAGAYQAWRSRCPPW
jgi:hypothetical protein